MISVDELAQEIRRVDGNHDKGAGALAEALMPFLTAALAAMPGKAVKQYCTDCESETTTIDGRCSCGSGRVIPMAYPATDLAAENERLREALEPFAEYARQNEVWLSKNDDAELSHASLDDMPKTGWIRGARAALERKP